MAARYQHVTDTMRSQVASQVGDLIRDSPVGSSDRAEIAVHRDSLVVVLAAAEACVAQHHDSGVSSTDLLAALADLRAALPPSAAPIERANETQTEPRRPPRP
jgi:hypothetical protein